MRDAFKKSRHQSRHRRNAHILLTLPIPYDEMTRRERKSTLARDTVRMMCGAHSLPEKRVIASRNEVSPTHSGGYLVTRFTEGL